MKNKNYILIVFLITSNIAFCNNLYQDTISLRNMSIDSINLEGEAAKDTKVKYEDSNKKHLFPNIELGVSYKTNEFYKMRMNFICDYPFNSTLFAGIGVGVHKYSLYQNRRGIYENVLIPVFIHLKSNFNKKKINPFFSFNVGYYLNYDKSRGNNLLLNPTLGLGFQTKKKSRFDIGIGLDLTNSRYSFSYTNGNYPPPHFLNSDNTNVWLFNINIGYSF